MRRAKERGAEASRALAHAIEASLRAVGTPARAAQEKRYLESELERDWLSPRAARASGLTVRAATKHLPAAEREAILEARGRTARAR